MISTPPTPWLDVHEREPRADIVGDTLTCRDIRSVSYTTSEEANYTCHYYDQSYDLRTLTGVWFFENNYAAFQSHIIISFEFTEGTTKTYLTVSAEVRKHSFTDFRVWHVFLKTFPIFYVLAPEEDVVYLRTEVRHTPVHMYRLALDPAARERLLRAIMSDINKSYDHFIPYRVGRSDCITRLMQHFRTANIPIQKHWWDWSPARVLLRSGLIEGTCTSLRDMRTRTLINSKVAGSTQTGEYSTRLRS
jgi:hypothetical protein